MNWGISASTATGLKTANHPNRPTRTQRLRIALPLPTPSRRESITRRQPHPRTPTLRHESVMCRRSRPRAGTERRRRRGDGTGKHRSAFGLFGSAVLVPLATAAERDVAAWRPAQRFGCLTEHPAAPWLEKAKAPRRSPQARADRGEPDSRSVRADVLRPPGADSPPQSRQRRRRAAESHRRGGTCRAGAHPATLSLHSTALRRDRAAWRDPPEAIRRPRRACGHAVAGRGRDSAGRRTRRPQGPRRPVRPRVRARNAGADCARSHPRLRSEPERAARTRLRGAGEAPDRQIGESASRFQGRAAERRGLPPRLRAAARGGSGARTSRHGSPPPRLAGAGVRSRPLCERRAIRARPRPLCRFGSQPIDPPAVKRRLLATIEPIPPLEANRRRTLPAGAAFWPFRQQLPPPSMQTR